MCNNLSYIPLIYLDRVWPDVYTTESFTSDFEVRKKAYFKQVLKNPGPVRGSKRAKFEIIRLAAGGKPEESVIHQSLTEYIEGRKDCADFVIQAIVRLFYQFSETKSKWGNSDAKHHNLNSLDTFGQSSVRCYSPMPNQLLSILDTDQMNLALTRCAPGLRTIKSYWQLLGS